MSLPYFKISLHLAYSFYNIFVPLQFMVHNAQRIIFQNLLSCLPLESLKGTSLSMAEFPKLHSDTISMIVSYSYHIQECIPVIVFFESTFHFS